MCRGCVIEFQSGASCVAKGTDHLLLSLIALTFSLLFQFRQLRCDYTRALQQIEGRTASIMYLPGKPGRKLQTRFRIKWWSKPIKVSL
jgi:hypothetical protein